MKSYFLKCDWKGNSLLYVPSNLIFIEEEDIDMFDIDYSPDSLSLLRKWNKKEPLFVRNVEYSFLKEINVPDELLEKFREACFNKKTLEAHIKAIEIFLDAKQKVDS